MRKLLSKATFKKIEAMLNTSGFTFVEIGTCCGISSSTVSLIARGKHFHQADANEQSRRNGFENTGRPLRAPHYLPTPDEISAACDRIQAARKRDEFTDEDGWTPPVYCERYLMRV